MGEGTADKGSCLCGAVKVSVSNLGKTLGACHCSMCRKWGGGPLMTVDCGTDVQFEGKDSIGTFVSSDWAERGFCKECGTHLFYRLKQSSQYFVPAGILSQSPSLKFDHQVFIDEKPENYSFSNQTKNLTGEQIFAMYGSS